MAVLLPYDVVEPFLRDNSVSQLSDADPKAVYECLLPILAEMQRDREPLRSAAPPLQQQQQGQQQQARARHTERSTRRERRHGRADQRAANSWGDRDNTA